MNNNNQLGRSNFNSNRPRVSKIQVLQSAAGYYIGTTWIVDENDIQPYSRESEYFKTEEAAEQALINNDYIQQFY